MIGSHYRNLTVREKGLKLSLTFESGEASMGLDLCKNRLSMNQYKEYVLSSALIGKKTLSIKADSINQISSIIGGGTGVIKVKEWLASTKAITESSHISQYQASIEARLGITENVSGAINGLDHTMRSITNGEDNGFASINIASNLYGHFSALTNLASGVIS